MATANNDSFKENTPTITGEPTDQLAPEEDLDDDLDTDDEPYEGIHHDDDDDDDMIDDNMTSMPVVPSPS